MRQFDGRNTGDLAYLECQLVTDLTDQDDTIPPHRQVDVRLPNNKVLRLPYAWLRSATFEQVDEFLDVGEDKDYTPGPPKKVAVRRAPPSQ